MEKNPIGFVFTREEASHILPIPALSFAINCSIEAGQKWGDSKSNVQLYFSGML